MTKLLTVLTLALTIVSCGNKSNFTVGNCYVATSGAELYIIRITDKIGENTFKYQRTDGKYLIDEGTWFYEGENYEAIDCSKVKFEEGMMFIR